MASDSPSCMGTGVPLGTTLYGQRNGWDDTCVFPPWTQSRFILCFGGAILPLFVDIKLMCAKAMQRRLFGIRRRNQTPDSIAEN